MPQVDSPMIFPQLNNFNLMGFFFGGYVSLYGAGPNAVKERALDKHHLFAYGKKKLKEGIFRFSDNIKSFYMTSWSLEAKKKSLNSRFVLPVTTSTNTSTSY